jgi:hypothetical protein
LTYMIYSSSSIRSSTWLIEDYEIIILIGVKSKEVTFMSKSCQDKDRKKDTKTRDSKDDRKRVKESLKIVKI